MSGDTAAIKLPARVFRLTLAVALAAFAVHIGAPSALACSCVELTPAEAFERADSVFLGEVASFEVRRGIFGQSGIDPATVNFKVSEVWKGPQQPTLTVGTVRSEASCGFEFVEGFKYLVYAREGQTGLCDRTALAVQAQDDLAALGDGWRPGPESDGAQRQGPTVGDGRLPPGGTGCGAIGSREPRAADLSVLGLLIGTAILGVRPKRRL